LREREGIVGREKGREQLEVRLASVKLKERMHGKARRVDEIEVLMRRYSGRYCKREDGNYRKVDVIVRREY
jgi:hypothetical protein